MMARLLLLFGSLVVLGQPGFAQPAVGDRAHIRGSAEPTRKRIEAAAKKLAERQTSDAVEDLQRILDDAGDDLLTTDGQHFRPARWTVHALLGTLPPQTLATYQDRIDSPARKLLDAAKLRRDPAPLWSLLDRYFVSRHSPDALRLLGDLLFERGEIRSAEVVWRRRVPSSGPDIAYPLATGQAAPEDLARLVLAAIFQKEPARAKVLLEELQAKHPGAAGTFAGVTGPYVATLASLIDKPPTLPTDPHLPLTWPTIAANPSRSSQILGTLPRHWPARPTWTVSLPPQRLGGKPERGPLRPQAFEPLLVNGRVLVSDGTQIFSIDRRTGERHSALLELEGPPGPPPVDSGRVFVISNVTNSRGSPESHLVSLAIPSGSVRGENAGPLKLWSLKAPTADGGSEREFLGPPLVVDRRLWVVLARNEGSRIVHAVACYDPADRRDAPEQAAWITDICDSTAAMANGSDLPRNVPALAGRHVVVCSQSGAVVALEAATGTRAWAFRYPRTATTPNETQSRVSAPVSHAGRVFIAPTDSDRIFALDAETGEKLWESAPCEGAQILGVTSGRLIVSVAGHVPGLRGLSTVTGSHREPEGWVQHRAGVPVSFGSGLVAERAIFWPTKSGLFVLNPETGEPLASPLRPHRDAQDTTQPAACFGPIAFADGCLVAIVPTVVGNLRRDQVWGYLLETLDQR